GSASMLPREKWEAAALHGDRSVPIARPGRISRISSDSMQFGHSVMARAMLRIFLSVFAADLWNRSARIRSERSSVMVVNRASSLCAHMNGALYHYPCQHILL